MTADRIFQEIDHSMQYLHFTNYNFDFSIPADQSRFKVRNYRNLLRRLKSKEDMALYYTEGWIEKHEAEMEEAETRLEEEESKKKTNMAFHEKFQRAFGRDVYDEESSDVRTIKNIMYHVP